MGARETLQELRELGLDGTLFRLRWEATQRTGLAVRLERPPPPCDTSHLPPWNLAAPWAPPTAVAAALRARIPEDSLAALQRTAADDAAGRVLCFHHDVCDLGADIDWYLHPWSRQRWNPRLHWSRSLTGAADIGDPKQTWEPARFPQACRIARAAAFADIAEAPARFGALARQVEGFLRATPYAQGLHWFSSQEGALRLHAWLFALRVFEVLGVAVEGVAMAVSRRAWELGHFTEAHLEYAERAVSNNHLLTEALGLLTCGLLAPAGADAIRWRRRGVDILTREAGRQFYADGAYLNLSHNYHRTVMQEYVLACRLHAHAGLGEAPRAWRDALARSVDFLVAHQNPSDGALPNYGHNDGSLPRPLSTCDFSDFRPTLQCASVLCRGERLYPPGPWDEELAWTLGPASLDAPLRGPPRRSVSFTTTGFHVLRGRDPRSFAAFRCGPVPDRYGQIDMLHVDLWWRGLNVLVDGGTFLYNGPRAWLDHFTRTGSHNTVTVDGRDQMLHWRQFKFLYRAHGRLLRFADGHHLAVAVGEHDGYARHPGGCVHRRAVLLVKDRCVVVVDRVAGVGAHELRLHWLAAKFPHAYDDETATLRLDTPEGSFALKVFDGDGRARKGDVVSGTESPIRAWISRRYAQRVPGVSLAVTQAGALPFTFVTLAGDPEATLAREGARWRVRAPGLNVSFALRDGVIEEEEHREE